MTATAKKIMMAELETDRELLCVLGAIHEAEAEEQGEFKMRLWNHHITSFNCLLATIKLH